MENVSFCNFSHLYLLKLIIGKLLVLKREFQLHFFNNNFFGIHHTFYVEKQLSFSPKAPCLDPYQQMFS